MATYNIFNQMVYTSYGIANKPMSGYCKINAIGDDSAQNLVYFGLTDNSGNYIGKLTNINKNDAIVFKPTYSTNDGTTTDFTGCTIIVKTDEIDETNTAAKLYYNLTGTSNTRNNTYECIYNNNKLLLRLEQKVFKDITPKPEPSGITVYMNAISFTNVTNVIFLSSYQGDTFEENVEFTMATAPSGDYAQSLHGDSGTYIYYVADNDSGVINDIPHLSQLKNLVDNGVLTRVSGTELGNYQVVSLVNKFTIYKNTFGQTASDLSSSTIIYCYAHTVTNTQKQYNLVSSFTMHGGSIYKYNN